jgi:hypothetical protein
METGSLANSGIAISARQAPNMLAAQKVPPQKGRGVSFEEFDRGRLSAYLTDGGEMEQSPDIPQLSVSVGDTKIFYGGESSYTQKTFTAFAVGSKCIVWGTTAFTDAKMAQRLADEFDSYIYPMDTAYFGEARYMPEVKLNILVYNMKAGICGFFWGPELMTASELQSIYGVNPNNWNHDAPFFHLNSAYATDTYWETARNTLVHEFQHLLHFTSALLNEANVNIEESMSFTNEGFAMEAEELLYPGSVAAQGYNISYTNATDTFAKGMSPLFWQGAAGVENYALGWAFFDWLYERMGSPVFSGYLSHWRTASQAQLMDSIALYAASSKAVRTEIQDITKYSDATETALSDTPNASPYTGYDRSKNIYLSELLLAFHIASIVQAEEGIYSLGSGAQGNITHPRYTSTASAVIQGGMHIYQSERQLYSALQRE